METGDCAEVFRGVGEWKEKFLAEYALLAGEIALAKVLEAVPDAVLILNEQRCAVYANAMACETLGAKSIDEVLGKRPGELLDCIHVKSGTDGCGSSKFCRYCGAVHSILGALGGVREESECVITDSTFRNRRFTVWSSPCEAGGRDFCIFILRCNDDDFRHHKLRRDFLSDIQNLLSNIDAMLDMGEQGGLSIAEVRQRVYNLTASIHDQIGTFQELSDAENNELEIVFSKVDSSLLIREVVSFFRDSPLAMEKFIVQPEDRDNISFNSDSRLLRRVLIEMVKNALESSSRRDVVKINCKSEGGRIIISVHNNQYIPADIQRHIFKYSFSTKGLGRGHGTYFMKLLVERHLQGRVWVQSSPKQGSSFHVSLPHSPAGA